MFYVCTDMYQYAFLCRLIINEDSALKKNCPVIFYFIYLVVKSLLEYVLQESTRPISVYSKISHLIQRWPNYL